MKSKKTQIGLLVATALMSLSHTAKAHSAKEATSTFVPLEQLSSEERAHYEQLIRELEKYVRIDWETVILGVDENGKLIIRARDADILNKIASPSTWTGPL